MSTQSVQKHPHLTKVLTAPNCLE